MTLPHWSANSTLHPSISDSSRIVECTWYMLQHLCASLSWSHSSGWKPVTPDCTLSVCHVHSTKHHRSYWLTPSVKIVAGNTRIVHLSQIKCLIWGGLWHSFGKSVPSIENQPKPVWYWSMAQIPISTLPNWPTIQFPLSTLAAQILSSTNHSPTTADWQMRSRHKKVSRQRLLF